MIYVLIFMIFVTFLVVLFIIKDHLTYSNSMKAIKFVYFKSNWKQLDLMYKKYDDNYLFFHPFKWTYKQMFPELYKMEKDIK